MQRRPRIKPVANLSASRRSANKSNSDSQSKTSQVKGDSENSAEISKVQTNDESGKIPLVASSSESEQVPESSHRTPEIDKLKSVVELNEKPLEPKSPQTKSDPELHNQLEPKNASVDVPLTFKTPSQLHRNEKDTAGCSTSNSTAKPFRKFKITPRLTASRNVAKVSEF